MFYCLQEPDAEGLLSKLEELRTVGLTDGKKRLGEVLSELEEGEVFALSGAAGLRGTDDRGRVMAAWRVRAALVEFLSPQAMRWV